MRAMMNYLVMFVVLAAATSCLYAEERPMLDRVMSVTISSGKAEPIGAVDVQDGDVEIVSRRTEGGGSRKYFWRLAEKAEMTVAVHLPADATDVVARVWMDSSVKKQGEAHLAWNGRTLGDEEEPFVLRAGDAGRNVVNVYLDDPMPENQLKLIGMKGEIDLNAVEFRYRVPCPSWENDKVRMTLLEPQPDQAIAKDSKDACIDLRWTASGPMEQGWIKIEYSEPGKEAWTAVPGAEAISFGSKEWPAATGSLTWRYNGDLPNLEFRVLFHRGANPIMERQRQEQKTAEAVRNAKKNLLERKRKGIEEIKTAIDPTLWRRHDSDSQRTATKCLEQAREELSKPDADIASTEQFLAEADRAILLAFEKMEAAFSRQEDTEVATWKDLLSSVELYLKEHETLQAAATEATEKAPEAVRRILAIAPVTFSSAETAEILQKNAASIRSKIGSCFYSGKGVKQDYAEAVKWFREAAEQGDADAQRRLGECYYFGNGVTEDEPEAVKWFRKAAEQGDAIGQAGLGECYYLGNGVAQDHTEAVKWFRKAAEQGLAVGQVGLGGCYLSSTFANFVKMRRLKNKGKNICAQISITPACNTGCDIYFGALKIPVFLHFSYLELWQKSS